MSNRAIKFKLWDKLGKSFFGGVFEWNKLPQMLYPEDFILCQYTGHKDKNNIDIYEGDIVKSDLKCLNYILGSADLHKENGEPLVYTNGEVKWVNSGFNVCQHYLGRTLLEAFCACDCCPCCLEIIGNIFENPELKSKLKDKDLLAYHE